MNIIRKLLLPITICTLLLPSISIAQIRLEPLESVRDQIVFPELSNSEKRVMVEQAQIFLRDLYVHRFEKLDFYQGLEDPVPAIEDVVRNIDSLTSAEMEETIYRIFVSQRDLHLNYIFPSPYGDYRSLLPLTLTRTASEADFFEVRVNAFSEDLFDEFASDQRRPLIGDQVLRYNKMPIRRAVRRQLETAQGANRFGGFSRALGQMTVVPHFLHLVPEENEVEITLMSSGSTTSMYGEIYTVTLPWITQVPDIAATQSTASALQRQAAPKKFDPSQLTEGVDLWQKAFNDITKAHGLVPKSEFPSNPSNEPALTWGVIDTVYGNYGYLRLTTFSPGSGTDFTLEEVRRLIFEELSETRGLIFDVRNNGGGSIVLADKLSQLFMPNEALAINARLLNTDLNREIFNNSIFGQFSNPEWTEVINEAEGTGWIHTNLAPFTRVAQANELGQSYYKPVAVLANARSYSATDLFSCSMQDNGAAVLYGEDPRTGAGGANVITHALFNQVLPSVFEALPGNHAMRVSWRQSVRFGPSEGRVIEDFGCRATVDVSQTKNDVIYGNEDQIRKVTLDLFKRSAQQEYQPTVRADTNDREVFLADGDANFDLYVKNTKYVDVLVDGVIVDRVDAFAEQEEEPISIQLSGLLAVGASNKVTFEGRDYDENLLWNLKRQFVVLEEKVSVEDDGFEIDFAIAESVAPFAVLNQGPDEDGWNVVSPYLQVGYNPEYVNNVNTNAVLLMDLTAMTSTALEFDMGFDTEADFDFINVFVTDSVGNNTSLLFESGFLPFTTFNFDISEFAGQDNVLLQFRFTSDGGVVAPGVQLQRVSISPLD